MVSRLVRPFTWPSPSPSHPGQVVETHTQPRRQIATHMRHLLRCIQVECDDWLRNSSGAVAHAERRNGLSLLADPIASRVCSVCSRTGLYFGNGLRNQNFTGTDWCTCCARGPRADEAKRRQHSFPRNWRNHGRKSIATSCRVVMQRRVSHSCVAESRVSLCLMRMSTN